MKKVQAQSINLFKMSAMRRLNFSLITCSTYSQIMELHLEKPGIPVPHFPQGTWSSSILAFCFLSRNYLACLNGKEACSLILSFHPPPDPVHSVKPNELLPELVSQLCKASFRWCSLAIPASLCTPQTWSCLICWVFFHLVLAIPPPTVESAPCQLLFLMAVWMMLFCPI